MERRVFAELIIDEDIASRNAEVNGIPYNGDIEYLMREFGWLETSGVRLGRTFVSDEDDAGDWISYIDYVVSWAFNHTQEEDDYTRMLTYKEWLVQRRLPECQCRLSNKLVIVTPTEAAKSLMDSLGQGEPTINGDRTSEYLKIAVDANNQKFVAASLVEECEDLHPEDRGYALHIINDIDETDARTIRTSRLDEKELVSVLGEVLLALQEGRL